MLKWTTNRTELILVGDLFLIYDCCSINLLIVSIHVFCWCLEGSNEIGMQSNNTFLWPLTSWVSVRAVWREMGVPMWRRILACKTLTVLDTGPLAMVRRLVFFPRVRVPVQKKILTSNRINIYKFIYINKNRWEELLYWTFHMFTIKYMYMYQCSVWINSIVPVGHMWKKILS